MTSTSEKRPLKSGNAGAVGLRFRKAVTMTCAARSTWSPWTQSRASSTPKGPLKGPYDAQNGAAQRPDKAYRGALPALVRRYRFRWASRCSAETSRARASSPETPRRPLPPDDRLGPKAGRRGVLGNARSIRALRRSNSSRRCSSHAAGGPWPIRTSIFAQFWSSQSLRSFTEAQTERSCSKRARLVRMARRQAHWRTFAARRTPRNAFLNAKTWRREPRTLRKWSIRSAARFR
mmetsp:Transcript_23550/g.84042  ORF Transcript_23550/g.84042 Transcript_23550/m.84042 type:complete len:234 (+) Transcript_23550:643-1344(+)